MTGSISADHQEWTIVDCEDLGGLSRCASSGRRRSPIPSPAIVFLRGGDLFPEAAGSRDRLVQQLVLQTGATVVCPDYGSVWSARYPPDRRADLRGMPMGARARRRPRHRPHPDGDCR